MRTFACAVLFLTMTATAADDDRLPVGRTSNELVEITAEVMVGKEAVQNAIGASIPGSDLGGNVVVVEVTVRPLTEKPVQIWRDDFTLLSDRNGQRSTPFEPSQLAGAGALVVKTGPASGGVTTESPTTVWGSPDGRRRVPSDNRGVGNTGTYDGGVTAEMKDDPKKTASPLLEALRAKVLPEKKTAERITGLLYFSMDGKVKRKNLSLFYKTESGRLGLRFREEPGK